MVEPLRVITIPERYTLTVVLPGPPPKAIALEGRVAKLIAWLVQHRARIERVGTGSFIFNVGLSTFTPEIREHFPRQAASPEEVPGEMGPLSAVS